MSDTTAGEGVYRKTATIRATQWFKMGDHPAVKPYYKDGHTNDLMGDHGWIDTLEGGHVVTPGDWIATGAQGECWPIKPDIFAATYTLAAQPSAGAQEGATELDLYDDKVQEAIQWTMVQWGTALGLKTWTQGDGSESVDGDVHAEIHNILVDAGLRCKMTSEMATLAQPDTGDVAALREAAAWRVEYRMPNGLMAGTALFGSKAAADFIRSEATLETTLTPLYATPGAFDTADTNAFQFIIDTSAPATPATAMETLKQTVSIARVRLDARIDARIAASAQPDTGDVAALLALFGDDSELMVVERSAPSLEISTDSLRSEMTAALSKPNAQGREG